MCWSGEASYALAAAGLAATGYAAWKKDSPLLWLPLMYFSGMELLQGYTYSVIDQCGLGANRFATLLSYLHIAFQPFFGAMMALYFVPAAVRRLAWPICLAACSISAAVMIVQLQPLEAAGLCTPGRLLCGPQMCSVTGNWHIAWQVPVNGMFEGMAAASQGWPWHRLFADAFPTYPIAMFLVPFLLGSWKLVIYHLLMGPVLARLTTSNPNEIPAVWCLLSIGFLMIAIKTPVRRYLHVESWPLWRIWPGLSGARAA